jgi:hypothetical protein
LCNEIKITKKSKEKVVVTICEKIRFLGSTHNWKKQSCKFTTVEAISTHIYIVEMLGGAWYGSKCNHVQNRELVLQTRG